MSLVAALCLITSACQGSSNPKKAAQAPSATAVDINAAPRDQLQDGGTLTQPIDSVPATFNLLHAQGADVGVGAVMDGLLPSTFTTDAGAEFHVNHDYYDSIELKSTDPKQVVVYRINPKAMWYDGTPITWKDLEADWKAQSGKDDRFEIRGSSGSEDIESVVRGADDREAVVTFARKFADWQGLFQGMYPASTTSDPKVFNEAWVDHPLTTAGPFKFESFNRTTQVITLVRNEKWWGRPAKLERLVFRVIKPDAQIDALLNGEIDVLDIGPDPNKYKRAQSGQGIDLRIAGGPSYRHLTFNGAAPGLLSDVKVRRAVGLAIDRQALANAALRPLDLPAESLGNHIYMRNQKAYKDNSGEFAKPDLAQANAALDEAGWKLEGATRKKNGQFLKLGFVIPSGVATSVQESQLIQQQLKPLGVEVEIQTVPVNDFFTDYIRPGKFDLTLFSWIGTPYPISSAKANYQNVEIGSDGNPVVHQNYGRIGSKEIDDLFAEATQVFDKEMAAELGNRIDSLIWQGVHSLTLYQRPDIVAVKKDLANIGASGFQSTPIEDVGYVKQAGTSR